ncbi:MAG: YcaO-like family protein, partial [Asticcacaulis sp.]|nr:YcaO-like family protein [Asticcacaulis sp.]
ARLIRSGRPEIRLFNAGVQRAWVRGVDMTGGREVLVPAAMTYLGYVRDHDDEIINQNDSTGLACGLSAETARMAALCEVIERDVFASNWLLMRRPPRLDVAPAFERLEVAVQVALRGGRPDIRLFHLAHVFGVHVVMCVVTSADGTGAVGAAASPYILRAVEKAVCEGLYSWSSGRKLAGRRLESVDDIKRPTDHLTYYLPPDRFRHVLSLCEGGGVVSMLDLLVGEHRHVTSGDIAVMLRNDGFDAAAVDLTTPDVATLGMSVVRAVVPGLQPLIFGPACVHAPDPRRLNQWRRQWGIAGQTLNPNPHPFP